MPLGRTGATADATALTARLTIPSRRGAVLRLATFFFELFSPAACFTGAPAGFLAGLPAVLRLAGPRRAAALRLAEPRPAALRPAVRRAVFFGDFLRDLAGDFLADVLAFLADFLLAFLAIEFLHPFCLLQPTSLQVCRNSSSHILA